MKRYIKASSVSSKYIAKEIAAAIRNINMDYKVPMTQKVNGEYVDIDVPLQPRAQIRERSSAVYVLFSLNVWADLPMKIKTRYTEALGNIVDEVSEAYPDFDIQYGRYTSQDAFRGTSGDAIVITER